MHIFDTQARTDRLFPVLLLVWMGFGCRQDTGSEVDPDQPDFTTTDAAELYFNNVRSPFYHIEEREEAALKVFRYGKAGDGHAAWPLNPVIVYHWRSDMAYLIMEPADTEQVSDSIVFEIHLSDGTTVERVAWYQGNAAEQFSFAARLYNHMLAQHSLKVLFAGSQQPASISERDERTIKTVFHDYFRLVEAL